MKTKWPWITIVLALVLAFLPPVNDIINSAFFSGVGVVFVLGLIEWGIRWYAARRRSAALRVAGQQGPMKES